jgi:hypothetical protein
VLLEGAGEADGVGGFPLQDLGVVSQAHGLEGAEAEAGVQDGVDARHLLALIVPIGAG